jgi:hypothetical protein
MTIRQPLYWRNEVSGKLEHAVMAYLEGKDLDETDIALLRTYFAQWVNATVFAASGELQKIQQSVWSIASTVDIDAWLEEAVLIGIDPL